MHFSKKCVDIWRAQWYYKQADSFEAAQKINIRVWRSLVSRLNGVQEASSSNLDTRTKSSRFCLNWAKTGTFFVCCSWKDCGKMFAMVVLWLTSDFRVTGHLWCSEVPRYQHPDNAGASRWMCGRSEPTGPRAEAAFWLCWCRDRWPFYPTGTEDCSCLHAAKICFNLPICFILINRW